MHDIIKVMKKHPILSKILILSTIFLLSHVYALHFALYWTTNWFDIYMHTFGGLLGSFLVVYVLSKMGISPATFSHKLFLFLFVIISVFAVAVVWELWEIYVGFIDPFEDFVDSIVDIIMGIIGAIIGFIYYDKKFRTKE
jgi:uncharacterized membrane protein YeaQ/YmgE (transglycosylase-associated protein family)